MRGARKPNINAAALPPKVLLIDHVGMASSLLGSTISIRQSP
jgi:hypothetical protein